MKTLHRAIVSAFLLTGGSGAFASPPCEMFKTVAEAQEYCQGFNHPTPQPGDPVNEQCTQQMIYDVDGAFYHACFNAPDRYTPTTPWCEVVRAQTSKPAKPLTCDPNG